MIEIEYNGGWFTATYKGGILDSNPCLEDLLTELSLRAEELEKEMLED